MKVEVEMYSLECCSCGMTFAMPKFVNDNLRKCHNTFYCPSGHPNYYPGKSTEEKLQEQLKTTRLELLELQEKERVRLEKQRNRRKGSKVKKS